jgi:hypothetical protein
MQMRDSNSGGIDAPRGRIPNRPPRATTHMAIDIRKEGPRPPFRRRLRRLRPAASAALKTQRLLRRCNATALHIQTMRLYGRGHRSQTEALIGVVGDEAADRER